MVIRNHYHEVLEFSESLMIFIIRSLQERPEFQRLTKVVDQVYPGAGNFKLPPGDKAVRITFAEGVKMLKETGIETGEFEDLRYPAISLFPNFLSRLTNHPNSTANEKALGKLILKKHNTDFYTIDKFPSSIRPFAPDPANPHLSNSYDFFMRGQEIMSGAQRIHNYDQLCAAMRNSDPPLDPESEGFRHYTDAFRYGCAPHGGGGLGMNRILQFFLNLPDIRFATLFVRDPVRKAP